jgi:hypothetical protein
VQYTIESRQLTSYTEPKQTTIEAASPDDAVTQFVRESECELVSLTKPLTGKESIATIRKNDSVFLLRVYAA